MEGRSRRAPLAGARNSCSAAGKGVLFEARSRQAGELSWSSGSHGMSRDQKVRKDAWAGGRGPDWSRLNLDAPPAKATRNITPVPEQQPDRVRPCREKPRPGQANTEDARQRRAGALTAPRVPWMPRPANRSHRRGVITTRCDCHCTPSQLSLREGEIAWDLATTSERRVEGSYFAVPAPESPCP